MEKRGERQLILKMLMLFYNYCSNTVGVNQIHKTYIKPLSINGNLFATKN